MTSRNAEAVQRHRNRQRARGLRPVQLWLPDTSTPEFKAQVAHDIAALAEPTPEEEALLDTLEQWAVEDLRE